MSGIRAFTPAQGIAALEKIMMTQALQLGVIDVGDWRLVKLMVCGTGKYLDEMKAEERDVKQLAEQFEHLVKEIQDAPGDEKENKIRNFMEHILKDTLKLPASEVIDMDQNFSELGVDSLMAMEMKNRLQGILGDKTLTVSALQENRTIRSLSRHLAILMNSDDLKEATLSEEELIQTDTVLPADIQAVEGVCPKPTDYKEILLTGVTGHLGFHILLELLTERPDLTIHCLVRSKTAEEGKGRIMRGFTTYEIEPVDLDRVRVVPGDVTRDQLGVGPEAYTELTSKVDAVLHCAIKANHLDCYSDGTGNDMRTHNVLGLLNVLRFVTSHRPKALFHASSLLAVTRMDSEGHLSEDFPLSEDKGAHLRQGYSLSKFIGEKLLAQAVERGIPCTVARYPTIFGHSVTGVMPPGYNHAWNILLSCIRVRLIPKVFRDGLPMMPVDVSAKVSTKLFLSDTAERGVYNFSNDSDVSEEDILQVFQEFGINAEYVSFKEWRDAVFDESGDDPNLLGPLRELYADTEDSETSTVFTLHPLAPTAESVSFGNFSQKLDRNLPGVREVFVSPKIVLQRHLNYHYKSITSQP